MPSTRRTAAPADEVARITLPSLVNLSQAAAALHFRHKGVRSAQGGNYLSSFKGRGMEFDETRPYTPGDDVRNLDWRVTARTGKTHTKLFREERERPVFISLDARASMFFATRGMFKSVMAARLAALVAWSTVQHGDRLGGQLFSENGSYELKPEHGRRAALRLLKMLADMEPSDRRPSAGQNPFDEALARLFRHARPGSLVFVFSDFRQLTAAGEATLIRLSRHCDLALGMVSDPLERRIPDRGRFRFAEGERDLVLDATPAMAAAHAEAFDRRHEQVRSLARQHRMRFLFCDTTDDPMTILRGSVPASGAFTA